MALLALTIQRLHSRQESCENRLAPLSLLSLPLSLIPLHPTVCLSVFSLNLNFPRASVNHASVRRPFCEIPHLPSFMKYLIFVILTLAMTIKRLICTYKNTLHLLILNYCVDHLVNNPMISGKHRWRGRSGRQASPSFSILGVYCPKLVLLSPA